LTPCCVRTWVWKLLILLYAMWPQVSLLRRFTKRRTKGHLT
jgi:hypothetical protein